MNKLTSDAKKIADDAKIFAQESAKEADNLNQTPENENKVTEKLQKIKVTVTGTFDGILIGRYYTSSSYQTVVTVENSTTTADASTTLEVVGSPDTGMSSVQTIYFIGLIVLLCGIGIIYANAKPVEEK